MGERTGIEWTNATWNPVVGCSRVSAGCKNCYAFRMHDMRHKAKVRGAKLPEQYAHPFTTIQPIHDRLGLPKLWKGPRRIFVNSTSDLFHEDVPETFIASVIEVIRACPRHTFQVLTKRPGRARDWVNWIASFDGSDNPVPVLPPNLWLGVSVENQEAAEKRIPILLEIPAAVRWLSCEPLLGPVNLRKVMPPEDEEGLGIGYDTLAGGITGNDDRGGPRIDWVVAGGESGPGARPMHPDWARGLRDQCQAAGVPFFFKQWGEWSPIEGPAVHQIPMGYFEAKEKGRIHNWDGMGILSMNCSLLVGKAAAGRMLDGREWNEYPKPAPAVPATQGGEACQKN